MHVHIHTHTHAHTYTHVQVLEVCNDCQREQLLARVRAQLCTLKRYTYGKHIVARMEKLLSAGAKIQVWWWKAAGLQVIK
jgi:hypothetical protein